MSRTILAALAVVGLVACGDRNREDVATADSLNRDLQLAPVDTTAELSDRPAAEPATPEPVTPAPAPRRRTAPTPRPSPSPIPSSEAAPAPAPSAARGLAAGTAIVATTTAEIRSNKNKVGDEVQATVANDVKDASGKVVIPAGAAVTLRVTAINESENKSDTTGTLTLQPTEVSINGMSHPLNASIERVSARLEGRKTGAGDIAKVGGGAAAGAVVGRVLGGSGKGAVIGGIIGGAVGAQRASETKDRDVVLPQGTAITMTLNERFTM
jgi:hypothetical protein